MKKILPALILSLLSVTCLADNNASSTVSSTSKITTTSASIVAATNSSPKLTSSTTVSDNTDVNTESSIQASVSVAASVKCGANTPCDVVNSTSKIAVDLINSDRDAELTNLVVGQFDFTLMTKYAMGTNWKLATSVQQGQLVSLFKDLLTYTYSVAVSRFKGAKTMIVSSTIANNGKTAAVVCKVTLPNSNNNQPITVEYDLANTTGSWKAYDIKIETASLVTTYRNQFNDVIQTNQVDGLIKQLKTKVASLKNKTSQATTTAVNTTNNSGSNSNNQ